MSETIAWALCELDTCDVNYTLLWARASPTQGGTLLTQWPASAPRICSSLEAPHAFDADYVRTFARTAQRNISVLVPIAKATAPP